MLRSLLRHLVPILHPLLWGIINGACLVWSLGMLALIFVYPDDPLSRDFVREHYYSYDLITCAVWVLEVTLDVIYFLGFLNIKEHLHHRHPFPFQDLNLQPKELDDLLDEGCCHHCQCGVVDNLFCNEQCRPLSLLVEMILATYFLIDSMAVSAMELREIQREDEHLTVDVIINAAAYLYITVRQLKEWRERMLQKERLGGVVDPLSLLAAASSSSSSQELIMTNNKSKMVLV